MSALGRAADAEDHDEILKLRAELEREQIRLAACGVVAMSDTPDSAQKARAMHPDYKSASCDEVARRVDECMALRAEVESLRAQLEAIGAGGVGQLAPLQPSPEAVIQMARDAAALGNIESPFNACMHQDNCKRWKAQASAATQSGGITPGWKLVPVAHTLEMSIAFGECFYSKRRACDDDDIQDIWDSLLKAAPQPPQVEQEPVAWQERQERLGGDFGNWYPCGKPSPKANFGQTGYWSELSCGIKYQWRPLYTHPQPKREPLTDDRIKAFGKEWAKEPGWYEFEESDFIGCIRAVERAHEIGGEE